MDGTKTVTATFAINTYTLSVTAVGAGTVAKDSRPADLRSRQRGCISPRRRHRWHSFPLERRRDGRRQSARPVPMDAPKSVTATFTDRHLRADRDARRSGHGGEVPGPADLRPRDDGAAHGHPRAGCTSPAGAVPPPAPRIPLTRPDGRPQDRHRDVHDQHLRAERDRGRQRDGDDGARISRPTSTAPWSSSPPRRRYRLLVHQLER